jgi:putative ABC transport system permease protein
LLTGGFLVFATQYLTLLRRRSQLALLRALGITRRSLVALLLAEGALIGSVGAILGRGARNRVGGDRGRAAWR